MDYNSFAKEISQLSEFEQLDKWKYVLETFFSHNTEQNFRDMQYIIGQIDHMVNSYLEKNGFSPNNEVIGRRAYQNFKLISDESDMYFKYKAKRDKEDQYYQTKKDLLYGIDEFLKKR